jgi:hypothetical protein
LTPPLNELECRYGYGTCTNDATRDCTLDTDCLSGGTCGYVMPAGARETCTNVGASLPGGTDGKGCSGDWDCGGIGGENGTQSTPYLLGLLWVTGMRVGEALRLDRDDVDFLHGALIVRDSKFGKSREVPVHESTTAALHAYAERREELWPQASSPAFFISLAGTRLRYDAFHLAFLGFVREAGLRRRSTTCRPRPHDLRHSFAVRTLIGWYRDGADVESRLPWLSTYLGHVHPANTYWYLSAAPELLGLAAERLETATEGRP